MIQQDKIFQGKIKAQILKQIFKDLGPKNLKNVDYFYMIITKQKIQMQFLSNSKDIQISIILKPQIFVNFEFFGKSIDLGKFVLQDFTPLSSFFQNNKLILDMQVRRDSLQLSYSNQGGTSTFKAIKIECHQDDEQRMIGQNILIQQQQLVQVNLSKVAIFDSVLSYARGIKLSSLWITYNSVKDVLQISDKKQNPEITWKIKKESIQNYKKNFNLEFHSKMLNCALNLLPNQSQLKITFCENCLLLDVPKELKKFTVKLSAKRQFDL